MHVVFLRIADQLDNARNLIGAFAHSVELRNPHICVVRSCGKHTAALPQPKRLPMPAPRLKLPFCALTIAVASAQWVSTANAQKTDALLGGVRTEDVTARTEARRFAVLLFTPSLPSAARASSWSVQLVAFEEGKEAKFQANLCDVITRCKTSAVDLTIAGPVDSKTHFTDLADLDGLVGNARVEIGGTTKLADKNKETNFTGRVTFSYPRFEFNSRSTLQDTAYNRSMVSIVAGLVHKGARSLVSASYRYESAYKPGAEINICTPAGFGPPGTTTCTSMVVSEPKYKNKNAAEVQLAYSWEFAAVRLTVAHDFTNGTTGFDAPIHLIPNIEGHLSGGVRLGYHSDQKRVKAGLFVNGFKL